MQITEFALGLATAFFCLLGPGMAWWHPRAAVLPRPLAWVGLSALWTTLAGLLLATTGNFSVPLLVLINATLSLAGYTLASRLRRDGHYYRESASAGPLVALALFVFLWPPFETHLGSQDSTTYTSVGVHLARSGKLTKTDEVAAKLPARLRHKLFPSIYGWGARPPFARMPGSMVTDSRESDVVRPSFVPPPYVWAALLTQAAGARHAGGYAPLFVALSLWACWQLCRRRIGPVGSLALTGLLALNAATYWAGRYPLSEPMAMFFLWTGLAAIDGFEEEGFAADAFLAGLLLGATATVRIEFLVFLPVALALRHLLASGNSLRVLGPAFYLPLLATMGAACLEAASLPGSYSSTVSYIFGGAIFKLLSWTASAPLLSGLAIIATLALAWWSASRLGLTTTLLAGGLAGVALYYTLFASELQLGRSLVWLEAIVGWPGLLLAVAGTAVAWRARFQCPGNLSVMVVALTASAFVLYDPHVIRDTIWASRRYVVAAVPVAIILAGLAAHRFGQRSALAGALVWTLLISSVVAGRPALSGGTSWQASPAPTLWNEPFYRGTYDQLGELAELLPADSVLLIDERLARYILGTPLWLIHDRPSVPVLTRNKRGRNAVAWLVRLLDQERELFLVKPTLEANNETIPFVKSRLTSTLTLQTLRPERTEGWPEHGIRYTMPVSLFRLEPVILQVQPEDR